MKYFLILSILTGIILSGLVITNAYGSVVEISFDDMVHQSELIVVGNVTAIEPTFEARTFSSPKDQFFHDVTLDIEMNLFKDVAFTEISFRIQKDRALEGYGVDISTAQDFEIGEKVLVFLTKYIDNDYWDGQYHVLGNHQGKYSIINGQAIGSHFNEISEEELISKIYQIKRENKIPDYTVSENHNYSEMSFSELENVCNDENMNFDLNPDDHELLFYFCDLLDLAVSEKHWNWLGYDLDWKNFVHNVSNEHVQEMPLFVEKGHKDSLVVNASISGRDSFPPPMYAYISFYYDEDNKTKRFGEKYNVKITGEMIKTKDTRSSPLKLFNIGYHLDEIKCKENLVLVQKYDGSPACVTGSTKQKLVDRGWMHWNSLNLMHNENNLYCSSSKGYPDQCYSLEDIVFGNARKNWKVYPGAGIILPENSPLTPIHKNSTLGLPQLHLTAMLDDQIFVNKCESNGGIWNFTYHD